MDDEKPDTRHLVLKPKEIVPTENAARPGDGTAISVQLIHRENVLAEQKASNRKIHGRVSANSAPPSPSFPPIFKPKELTPTDGPSKPGDEEAISVSGILLENRIAEEESGLTRLKWLKKRKSKRNRDFFLVVGGIDLAIGVYIKMASETVTTIYGISAITLITSTFAWIMFAVNDDY